MRVEILGSGGAATITRPGDGTAAVFHAYADHGDSMRHIHRRVRSHETPA